MLRLRQHHGDPARYELDEIKRVVRCLKSCPAEVQFAVGAGVCVANTDFMRRFGGIESFRQSSAADREQFYAKLGDLELSLRNRGPGMAIGIGLYRIWLADVLAERRQAADLLGEELAELSRKSPPNALVQTPAHLLV